MNVKRSIAAALIVALCVVTAHDAMAARNDGRFEESNEARHARICSELKNSYDFNMAYYKAKPSKRKKWKLTAENLLTLAQGEGCSWAA